MIVVLMELVVALQAASVAVEPVPVAVEPVPVAVELVLVAVELVPVALELAPLLPVEVVLLLLVQLVAVWADARVHGRQQPMEVFLQFLEDAILMLHIVLHSRAGGYTVIQLGT